ncbi:MULTISPECIES: glycine betaine ABC transporter substrate-binding protein [Burkholderiaceae]|uniref:glycine betaine ABC transporter substrate-binding protein n=1 Tax=Burkholderiaceae TaxID=119060 RepID=UPI0009679EF4|nr:MULTISPECIES: glycine betaine ABC transporter substrate-binding protein [Burkholderiaceae]MCG1039756.1 glycine betaine ABC transporter substrate-binding protein [Mycetohabitans sp. B7]SIT65518.1 osmoprotectant transport system substrate-binding protein [Burkholderia sp. b14]
MTRLLKCVMTWLLAGTALASVVPVHAATLVVGGKNFTEQLLLAEITSQYLRSRGYTVENRSGLGSVLLRSAMENRQLDIVWDYTGTALIVYNRIHEKLDPPTVYRRVRDLDKPRGLVWLEPSALNNTYALAMPRKRAERDGIHTISQLAAKIRQDDPHKRHWFAMDAEFANRPDGLRPLQALYDLRLRRSDVKQMDSGLVYTALHNDQAMFGLVYTTDGRIKGFGITVLDDDLGFFPAYNATPVVRRDVLDRHPELAKQLNALSAQINNEVMSEMNKRVDIDEESISAVAADFLRTHALP